MAGARHLNALDPSVEQRMMSIYNKGFEVIVGDCAGIDTSVQKFYSKLKYSKVTIYASNGRARNNIGNWPIHKVAVPPYMRGFDYYHQKDIAMANDADYGFMIWDGQSRGTKSNICNLLKQSKPVLVYLVPAKTMICIKNQNDFLNLIRLTESSQLSVN